MEPKPPSKETRRFHRKSRNGCVQCKQRHVKCDENKPMCGNCAQTSRACSFLRMMPSIPTALATGGSPVIGSRASGPPTPASAASSSATAVATPIPPFALPFNIDTRLFNNYSQTPEFGLADLSMLHHFTVHTSRTLSPSPEVQHLWGTTIVQLALQHRFLLHGVLALSALQASYTARPADIKNIRQLVDYASRHQTISLSLYQHALANPTQGQHDALFALSIVIFILAIATLRDENPATPEADGLGVSVDCKWIRLARGILIVNQDHFEELGRGPLALLMQTDIPLHPEQPKEEALPDDLQHLQKLWANEELSSVPLSGAGSSGTTPFSPYEMPMIISKEDREAFEGAYASLVLTRSRVFEHIRMLEADLAATEHHHHNHPNINNINYPERLKAEVFMWVLRVPEHYIDLLDQHNPIALIILAHYAALLCTDVNSWWCLPSAQAIISRIWAFLDEKSRKFIESPMADVRRVNG